MCCWKSEITSGAKRREVILTFNSSSRVNWQYKKNKMGNRSFPEIN